MYLNVSLPCILLVVTLTTWQITSSQPTPSVRPLVRPLSVHNTSAIVEKVLAGYQVEVGPLQNGRPVSVKVQVLINDMMAVAEADMHVSTDFYLRMEWTDYRFALLIVPYNSFHTILSST